MTNVHVKNDFSAVDYVVFAGMLVISMGIGVFFAVRGGRQKTQGEYLMANRSLHVLPVAISILVSFLSAILILGTPAEMYTQGTEYFLVVIGMGFAVILAAALWVPLLYPLKLTSAYEYLEKRYNSKAVRLLGTLLIILSQIIYMGIASFAPSTAFEAVTGFPVWATILVIGIVATFYTTLGGMKAVVWTDVFQALVMVGGVLAICIQGTIRVGGVSKVWNIADDWDRIQFFNFNPDPTVRHTVWSLVIGTSLQWMGTYGLNQSSVQRFSSLSNLSKARKSVLFTYFGTFILVTLTSYSGLVVFSFYASKNCDPLGLGMVENPNQLIPYFVMETLAYPGVPGLFISSLFSGALSSVSSSLNALAAITWEDFLKPHFDSKMSEAKKTTIIKVIVFLYGCTGIGMSFMAQQLDGTVLQAAISLIGSAGGPVSGMFILGAFFPWANATGAIVGAISGFAISMWLSIGSYIHGIASKKFSYPNGTTCELNATISEVTYSTLTSSITPDLTSYMTSTMAFDSPEESRSVLDSIYHISYLWYGVIAMLVVVIVGLPVSFITGPNKMSDVPTKYQIPFFRRLFCCFPNSCLHCLECERDFEDPEDIKAEEKDTEIIITPAMDEVDGKGGIDNDVFSVEEKPNTLDNPQFNDDNQQKHTNGDVGNKFKMEEKPPSYFNTSSDGTEATSDNKDNTLITERF